MHLERIGCSVFWVSERGGEPKFPNPRSTLCPQMYQSQLPAVQLSPELRSASGQSLHLEPFPPFRPDFKDGGAFPPPHRRADTPPGLPVL